MKQINKMNLQTLSLITVMALFLAACGNSKSNPNTTNSSSRYDISSQKILANCNKSKDSNFSMNSSIVVDQNGQTSSDWIKVKFNFLSAAETASGNTIKFFKWRVVGTKSQIDQTPLQFAAFDLSTGQTVGANVTNVSVSDVNSQSGFYIQLNDPNIQFQVLKVVVYSSDGKIVGQFNHLIPGFYASPIDYKYNSDGTARAQNLQELHSLYATDVSAWTSTQLQQSFNQYCF